MTGFTVSEKGNIGPRLDAASFKGAMIDGAKLAFASLAGGQDQIGTGTASAD